MKIKLDETWYLLSDSKQYILAELKGARIHHRAFFTNLVLLLTYYVQMKARTEENIESIQRLIDYQKSLVASLSKVMQASNIEVEIK